MHLRRALLLFAIVIGLAAVAATLSGPQRDDGRDPLTEPPPAREPATASPGSGTPTQEAVSVRFEAGRDQTRRVGAGQPATVLVSVEEPGQVEIPLLGLDAPAEPLTPARFDVLTSEPRRYPISFTPAGGSEPAPAGTLRVTEAEQ